MNKSKRTLVREFNEKYNSPKTQRLNLEKKGWKYVGTKGKTLFLVLFIKNNSFYLAISAFFVYLLCK